MLLYRHRNGADFIDLNPATGHYRHVNEDYCLPASELVIAYRHSYAIPGYMA